MGERKFLHIVGSYDHVLAQVHAMMLAGEIEMDESMYVGHRKGKRGWGAAGAHIVFGL